MKPMRLWLIAVTLLWAVSAWAAYSPTPVQKSQAERDLQTALDNAKEKSEKQQIAEKALADHPEDIIIGRLAQDALMRIVEDPAAYFKARAEGTESIAKKFLYARASGDSLTQIQTAEWILAKDPKHFWALIMKATTLWTEDEKILQQVESLLKEAVACDPSRPEGYQNLGYLYQDKEDLHGAREAFEAGAVSDPTNTVIRDMRLTVYAAQRDAKAYFDLVALALPASPLNFDLPLAKSSEKLVTADFHGHFTIIEYWAYS